MFLIHYTVGKAIITLHKTDHSIKLMLSHKKQGPQNEHIKPRVFLKNQFRSLMPPRNTGFCP